MKKRWIHIGLLAILAAALLCAGCAETGEGPTKPLADSSTEVQALFKLGQERMDRHDFPGAADAFRAAAQTARVGQDKQLALYRLASAQDLAGKQGPALLTMNQMDLAQLPPGLRVEAQILHGRLEAKAGQPEKAVALLRALLQNPPAPLTKAQAAEALDVLCGALNKLSRHPEAAQAYLRGAEQNGLTGPDNQRRMVELTGQVNGAMLAEMIAAAATPQMKAALLLGLAQAQLREGRLDDAGQSVATLQADPEARVFGQQITALAADLAQAKLVEPRSVGVILPLSGPLAATGSQVLAAVELGLGLFSQDGRGPTLYIEDSKGDPRTAAEAVEKLAVGRRVLAIIGPMRASTSLAAARQAAQRNVPLITLSRLEGVTGAGPCVFQNFFTPQEQVDAVLEEVMGRRQKRTVAILAPNNPYGKGFADLMTKSVILRQGSVVRTVFYDPNLPDFAAPIQKLAGLPPGGYRPGQPDSPTPVIDFEALFIPDGGARVGMIAPQLAFYDVIGMDLLGTSLWHDQAVLKNAGRYLDGCIFPVAFNPDGQRELVRGFVTAFQQNMGRAPNVLDAHGYDAALLVRRILDSPEPPRTRADFCARLAETKDMEGVCGVFSAGQDGRLSKNMELFTISRERFVPLAEAQLPSGPPSYPKPELGPEEDETAPGAGPATLNGGQDQPRLGPPAADVEPLQDSQLDAEPAMPAPASTIAR